MSHFLTVMSAGEQPFRVPLNDLETRLGRSGQNDLILGDLTISRRHAVIASQGCGDYLCDLGSRGSTLLNGHTLERPILLRAGDQIRLGNTMLVYDGEPHSPVEFTANDLPGMTRTTLTPGNEWLTPTPRDRENRPAVQDRDSASRYLQLILQADKALDIHLSLDELWMRTLDLVQQEVPFQRGVILTPMGDDLLSRATCVPEHHADQPFHVSRAITDQVLETGESLLVCDGLDLKDYRNRDSIVARRIRSLMCAPLLADDKTLGLIYVDTCVEGELFTSDSLHLLTHLASLAASRMESLRLLERSQEADRLTVDLDQAAMIQARLFPGKPPEVAGYAIHGVSEACKSVGGDHLDYFCLEDGRLAMALGDVAGKGLPAALIMCSLRSSLRALALSLTCPAATVTTLSHLLSRDLPNNRFVTLFYGILDPAANLLTYVNAGHCPPLLVHANGNVEELAVSGLPAGILDYREYRHSVATFLPGDHLITFSDGVPEASNTSGEFFGNRRIRETLMNHHSKAPVDLVEALLHEMKLFHGASPQEDDVTVMALRRLD